MKDTTVSFKIERALKTKLVAIARSENRTLSNFIEKILKEEIAKYESKYGRIGLAKERHAGDAPRFA